MAAKSELRTLAEACKGADVFLGLSAGHALKKEWAETMSDQPIVLAMANPVPEITLEDFSAVKKQFV